MKIPILKVKWYKDKVKDHYSNCCYAYMPDYPDSDICPKCGEHCGAEKDDVIGELRKEGKNGSS